METVIDDAYDPFEMFDDVIAGDTRDPYPDFAQKRRETPVWKGSLMGHLELPEGLEVGDDWICFRYEDCSRVLRDAKTFTSTGYDATIGMVMGHMILGMDDPEHRRHRNLVAAAFRERSLARWEPDVHRPHLSRADRPVRRSRPGRPGAGADLRVPGAGHRPASWACPRRTSPSSSAGPSS